MWCLEFKVVLIKEQIRNLILLINITYMYLSIYLITREPFMTYTLVTSWLHNFFLTFNHKTSVIHLSQINEFTSLISDSVHCFYTTTSNEPWTIGVSKNSCDSGMGTYMYTCTCSTLILVPDWYKKSGVTGFLENSKTRL